MKRARSHTFGFLSMLMATCFALSPQAWPQGSAREPAQTEHAPAEHLNPSLQTQALTVERIEIQGATKTRPHVILRYLSLKAGDEITPEKIARDYDALSATHFFKQVDFSSKPGSAAGKVVLVIEVVERRWPWLEFAGGASELNGWYLIPLGVRFDNFFGGGGLSGARFVLGDRIFGFYLHYRQPYAFGGRINFLVELGSAGQEFIHYLDQQQAMQKVQHGVLRFDFSGKHGLARYLAGGFKFNNWQPEAEARFTYNGDTITDLPSPLADQLEEQKVNSIFARLQLDTRDNHFFPRAGVWGALSFEIADAALGSEVNFYRAILDGRFYHAFGKNVFALHAKAGRVSEAAPFYERFYLGGAYSLRGFAERSLTPLGYGTELALAQAEMRFPVTGYAGRPSLSAALFFDVGRIDAPDTNEENNEFISSAGFGFRLRIPVLGLLRGDFAYPLDRDDFRFHLALEQTF